jgi:hypothetical protein
MSGDLRGILAALARQLDIYFLGGIVRSFFLLPSLTPPSASERPLPAISGHLMARPDDRKAAIDGV